MQDGIEHWTRHLLAAFNGKNRGNGARLGRTAAVADATSLWHVVDLGLRIACLISSFAATPSNVGSLRSAIANAQYSTQGDDSCKSNVAILVHAQSEQTFVVNLSRFMDEYRRHWDRMYFAVDGQMQGLSQPCYSMPKYLQSMLNSVHQCAGKLSAEVSEERQKPAIIVLSAKGLAPTAGVALAGWLLEYSVVYCFSQVSCVDKELQDDTEIEATLLSASEYWARQDCQSDLDTRAPTQLCGIALLLVTVRLQSRQLSKQSGSTLCQFTLPEELAPSKKDRGNIEASIRERFESRLENLVLDACITVSFDRQVMDRVAI